MKILANQIPAHKTPADAWAYAKMLIERFGDSVITEDRKLTREVCNLHLCVLEPLAGWPIAGSGWNLEGLAKYYEQLMDPEPAGFDYTYGERLLAYDDNNQIRYATDCLKSNPTSRRAVAITWMPKSDQWSSHVPCLQLLDFLIRDGKLDCTAVFRSWDVLRAAVPNMYGLARLMQCVANAVGVPVGGLTIIAASAHIYEV